MQNTVEGTIPDVIFKRVDDAPLGVDVYLDGYYYHARPGLDRLADDADKRARLRAEGHVVFQLDWDDVNAMADDRKARNQVWEPYQGNAQMAARAAYQRLGEDPATLPDMIWCTPVHTLFAFLSAPAPDRWRKTATAALAGLIAHPGGARTSLDSITFTERIRESLHGRPLPSAPAASRTLVRVPDASGCLCRPETRSCR